MELKLQKALENCAREAIHIPGSIQSHGFLITLDLDRCAIVQVSENTESFLEISVSETFDTPFDKLPIIGLRELIALCKLHPDLESLTPSKVKIKKRSGEEYLLNVICHRVNNLLLLEFEPAPSSEELHKNNSIFTSVLSLLSISRKVDSTLEKLVVLIKDLINYDRVMIYRFAEDWHGEVVAEAKDDTVQDSFLGLHFPAGDIPVQARQLYIKNLVRIIADVNAEVAYLEPQLVNDTPINLEHSVLRAVSPVHIQYLKNMGVGASFSISIVIDGKLWGLIACHNNSAKFIPFEIRQSCKLVSNILSFHIQNILADAELNYRNTIMVRESKIMENIRDHWSIPNGLCKKEENLLSLCECGGAMLFFKGKMYTLGNTPTEKELLELMLWFDERNEREYFFQTEHLSNVYPSSNNFRETASGVMSLCLSRYLKEYIMWFKPEIKKTVTWGGNPKDKVEIDTTGNLSPRKSFAKWQEEVNGISSPWKNSEIAVALKLKEDINEVITFQANEIRGLNEKLLQANMELDAFSYTISHDLKSPLTTVKSYTQIVMKLLNETIDKKCVGYLEKILTSADKIERMINDIMLYTKFTREVVQKKPVSILSKLQDILNEMTMNYDIQLSNFQVGETPDLYGDTTMIKQIFQNLISNAVKYSRYENAAIIKIKGWRDGAKTIYSVADNGIGFDMQDATKIFEIFHRLPETDSYEGHGVGLAIVKRLVNRHDGTIWVESKKGFGSTFYFSFPDE